MNRGNKNNASSSTPRVEEVFLFFREYWWKRHCTLVKEGRQVEAEIALNVAKNYADLQEQSVRLDSTDMLPDQEERVG